MSFLAPLGLAFAALGVAIIALHMLKMKRRLVPVSSTLLWKKALEDLRANAPFQRLRRSLLLILQLLAVAGLAVALGNPVRRVPAEVGRKVVILLDASASMRAREADGRSRIDLARDEARHVVDALGPTDRAAVIVFEQHARLVAPLTSSQPALRAALEGIEATDLPTDVREAFALAGATARQAHGGGEILLISDGRFPPPGELDLAGAKVRYLPVGHAAENAGIVALDLRRPLDEHDGEVEVLARVANHAPASRRITATLAREPSAKDGHEEIVDAKELEIAPEGSAPAIFALRRSAEGVFRISIERGGGADAFALDDAAELVVRPPEKTHVVLVTPGNYFLERLLAVDPTIVARKLPPADASAPIGAREVAIFDRAPPREAPPGGAIYVGCAPPDRKLLREDPVKDPRIADWDALHPTARFSSFGEIAIAEAAPIALGPRDHAILSSTEGALLAEVRSGEARAIAISFDIMKSDWPLKTSFPLFLGSAIRYVAARGDEDRACLRVGEAIAVTDADLDGWIAITDPKGETRRIRSDATGRASLAETRIAGRYTVDLGGGRPPRTVAVNLLDARESDIATAPSLDLGERPVETVVSAPDSPHPLWKPFALAALALVMLEWWIYHRRAYL